MIFFRYVYIFILLFSFHGCDSKNTTKLSLQDEIVKSFKLELLKDEVYYFPAKGIKKQTQSYLALERFDLIFTAYDVNSTSTKPSSKLLSNAIPGDYTHMLMYIGKDTQGFAYGVEMNSNINQNIHIENKQLTVDGQFYIYCLGNDFGLKSCPKDNYFYGIEKYDYMWAKRLNKELHSQLIKYENELMQTIKQDLISRYPFQLPFNISSSSALNKQIIIVDDGYRNGGDCSSYFISLFEKIASVCLEDIRISTRELKNYYLYDPLGKKAIIPIKYNIIFNKEIYFTELLNIYNYSFVDQNQRQTECSDRRKVQGLILPSKIFHSASMIEIPKYEKTTLPKGLQ